MIHATSGTGRTVSGFRKALNYGISATLSCRKAGLTTTRRRASMWSPTPPHSPTHAPGPVNPTPGSPNVTTLPSRSSSHRFRPPPPRRPAPPLEGGSTACIDDDNESKKDFCGLYTSSFSSSSLPGASTPPSDVTPSPLRCPCSSWASWQPYQNVYWNSRNQTLPSVL
jgi:hypothetical protein